MRRQEEKNANMMTFLKTESDPLRKAGWRLLFKAITAIGSMWAEV
jgi:hypothetical protein